MLSLFGENSSIQRALMISASAATTAGFLQAPTDLGAVSFLESTVQPISWLALSCFCDSPSASRLPVSSAGAGMPDGQVSRKLSPGQQQLLYHSNPWCGHSWGCTAAPCIFWGRVVLPHGLLAWHSHQEARMCSVPSTCVPCSFNLCPLCFLTVVLPLVCMRVESPAPLPLKSCIIGPICHMNMDPIRGDVEICLHIQNGNMHTHKNIVPSSLYSLVWVLDEQAKTVLQGRSWWCC